MCAFPDRRSSGENRARTSAPPPTDPLLRHPSANSRLLQPDTSNQPASRPWDRSHLNRPDENAPDERDLCLTRPPQHSRLHATSPGLLRGWVSEPRPPDHHRFMRGRPKYVRDKTRPILA